MLVQVFSSRYVTKRNANLLDAFGGTNGAGRIGHVIDGKVLQYYRPNGKLLCYGYPLSPSLPDVTLQVSGDPNVLQGKLI